MGDHDERNAHVLKARLNQRSKCVVLGAITKDTPKPQELLPGISRQGRPGGPRRIDWSASVPSSRVKGWRGVEE
jgi:hypothetical protein